jgi:DNA-binding beta-propeller fold protein YncE
MFAACGLGLLAGCPADAEDVRPPESAFYFPIGAAISPDESVLFVSNANSDLRYGSSSLQVVDLDLVDARVRTWVDDGQLPAGCTRDLEGRGTAVCPEEDADFLRADATVRMGNFAGEVRVQARADGAVRVFVPSRGDPSITWGDYTAASGEIDCGGTGSYPRCDSDHLITRLREDAELIPLTVEPFGMYIDSARGHLVVAHLTTGNISLITTPPDGDEPPMLVDVKGGFFGVSPITGLRGAVAVAGRLPGSDGNLLYVTSRAESRIQMLHVEQPPDSPFPLLSPTDFFLLSESVLADEQRGLTFSADGNRAYIVGRRPPALITVDTSIDELGRPRNDVIQVTEICPQAGYVEVADVGKGERAYITCFRDGQVWVVDPESAALEAVVTVGGGPHNLAVSPTRSLLYVTNFLDNTIAVIDLTPGAPTENRVVVRLGEPELGSE